MGTQLENLVLIPERLRPIEDEFNKGHYDTAYEMSKQLNIDVLNQRGLHRNVNVSYWLQRAMIELRLKKLSDALVSYKTALTYSNGNPGVRHNFMREVAIFLIETMPAEVPVELRSLAGEPTDVTIAVRLLVAPMADMSLNDEAHRVSIIGRLLFKRALRAHGERRDSMLHAATTQFALADHLWNEVPDEARDTPRQYNNRVRLFTALKRIGARSTSDELRQRDELRKLILSTDPSRKRRVIVMFAGLHRELGPWLIRRLP